MDDLALFFRFGVALALGIFVGLQRERDFEDRTRNLFAGVRTFGLLSLLGSTAAFITDLLDSPLPYVAALLVLGIFLAIAYGVDAVKGKVGLTTETAVLVIFFAGSLAFWNYIVLAVALTVITTALLSFKEELHGFAYNLSRDDILATLKFAIMTAVVLPILPNQDYGPPPFDVFNPYEIWLFIVLVSGISFVGYVLFKATRSRQSIGLVGLLGGIVSSTAVTLSLAQRSQEQADWTTSLSLAIVIGWMMTFVRVLVLVGVLSPSLFWQLLFPVVTLLLVAGAYTGYLFLAQKAVEITAVELTNPFELKTALKFGLLYTAVLVMAAAAQFYIGETGVYISSLIGGLSGISAITLSMAELSSNGGTVSVVVAARAIIFALLANTVSKGVLVSMSGTAALRRRLLPLLLLLLLMGAWIALQL